MSNSYETILVFSVKNGDEAVAGLVEKFKNLIEANGTLESVDEWGKRKLAYLIDDEADGFYVLYNYSCPADFPAEFDRVLKITDGVLRSLIVRK